METWANWEMSRACRDSINDATTKGRLVLDSGH